MEATVVYMKFDNVWTVKVRCPYCGSIHKHGGGNSKKPFLGHRSSHCARGEYVMVLKESVVMGLPANYFVLE